MERMTHRCRESLRGEKSQKRKRKGEVKRGEHQNRKKQKAIEDGGRVMGFGPSNQSTYGELLRSKPRYVSSPIAEGGGR